MVQIESFILEYKKTSCYILFQTPKRQLLQSEIKLLIDECEIEQVSSTKLYIYIIYIEQTVTVLWLYPSYVFKCYLFDYLCATCRSTKERRRCNRLQRSRNVSFAICMYRPNISILSLQNL